MAEETGQDKTIPPSERRREEARRQGQVAASVELTAGLLLLAGVAALWLGGPKLAGGFISAIRLAAQGIGRADLGPEQAQALLVGMLAQGGELIGLGLGLLFVVGVAAGVAQAGFNLAPELVLPNWDRVNPANGWPRILSTAAAVRGLLSVVKVVAVAALAFWVLKGQAGRIGALGDGSLSAAAAGAWGIAMRLALSIAAAMLLVGAVDYLYQWRRHEYALHLTPQEAREEHKREEGDPQVKARIRKLQREAVRKRMWEDVPRATVVVTNPTHLAVALRYERGAMPAPKVVAKGAGFVAERIVELARRHAVPVVERKPLAQGLFKAAKVGQEIPMALYYAVAEVLAYVYKLRGAA